MTAGPRVDIRRASARFVTDAGGVRSRHCFSFGRHYDPTDISHGLLLASNDDVVQPGAGFDPHRHRDLEIVTWVLQGSLVHEDSTGHRAVVTPGLVQRMSAGSGVLHSERNEADELVRLVQMWVMPDTLGVPPGYEQCQVSDALRDGDLVVIAAGPERHEAAVRIRQREAALHVARLQPGQQVQLPEAPFLHLFVARGEIGLEGSGELGDGDAVRFTREGGQRITATTDAEVLVWAMDAAGR